MMRTKLLLFSLILLCLATPAQAADINAASCSQADVQNAINAAVDGDRVLIPAGTCIWSERVSVVNKGITLEGAGIGVTTLINNFSSGLTLRVTLQAGDPTFNLTALTIDGATDTPGKAIVDMFGGGLNAYRIHHMEFANLNGTGLTLNSNGLEVSGLVDHVTFTMNLGAGDKAIRVFGGGANGGSPSFARGLELGSEKYNFIEDCTFNFSAVEDGAVDGFSGSRVVFRHNTLNNTKLGTHGADSGGFRGVHSFEIYNNVFAKDGALPSSSALFFRSGAMMIFNNTFTGPWSDTAVANYRSRPQSFAPWGQCDGSSVWDENQDGQSGYACLDQIGHIFGEASGGSNTLEGFYYWSNTDDGTAMTNIAVSEASMENHLKDDREFYTEDLSFDGTSGVGVGLISARPSTCTVQVGYWATDQSKFYRCLTTDTWTFYYAPFTYPHPLQAGGGGNPRPDPPPNLGAIVR